MEKLFSSYVADGDVLKVEHAYLNLNIFEEISCVLLRMFITIF